MLFDFVTARTLDGGQTWEQTTFSQDHERRGFFSQFRDKNHGFLITGKLEIDFDVIYCSKTELFTTNDGGQTWVLREIIEDLCGANFSRHNSEITFMAMQNFLFKIEGQ